LPQLNLKQADAVKFYTNMDEALGWDDSLTTLYGAIADAGLGDYMFDAKTVATLFAPSDNVSPNSNEGWQPFQCCCRNAARALLPQQPRTADITYD
jgi:hypothetical protein